MTTIFSKTIELDGKKYVVADGQIQVETFRAWADAVRTVGNQQRGDRVNASQWVQEDWSAGWGFHTVKGPPILEAGEPHPSYKGFFDSSVETRWQGQVTLAGLSESVSHENDGTSTNPDHDYYRIMILPHSGSSGAPGFYAVCTNASESIARDNNQLTTDMNEFADLTSSFTNFLPRCTIGSGGIHYIFGGTDSAVATNHYKISAGGAGSSFTPTTNFSATPHSVVNFRDILYAAVVDATNGVIKVASSTDDGANWSDITGMEVSFYPGADKAELIEYYDANGQAAVYLLTNAALYLCDFSDSALEPVIAFRDYKTDSDLSRPRVWRGNLYLPRKDSLTEFHFSGAWRELSPFVLARIPSENLGSSPNEIAWIYDTDGWLMMGHISGTHASVHAYDGQAWHYIWSVDGSGVISNFDGAVISDSNHTGGTLLMVYKDAGASTDATFVKIDDLLVEPTSVTKTYESSGELITPWFDGGMTEVDAAVLGVGMGAGDLDTEANDNEKIQVEIAKNYSTTYESASGTILTFYSDSAAVQEYASGAGISARVWRHKYTLSRGSTNTNTPVMYYPVAYYEKIFPDLNRYTMEIDVRETARADATFADEQDVLRSLKNSKDKIPLLQFSYPAATVNSGGDPTYVRMINKPTLEALNSSSQNSPATLDDLRVQLVLEERL